MLVVEYRKFLVMKFIFPNPASSNVQVPGANQPEVSQFMISLVNVLLLREDNRGQVKLTMLAILKRVFI
jgi:hypothetical protein